MGGMFPGSGMFLLWLLPLGAIIVVVAVAAFARNGHFATTIRKFFGSTQTGAQSIETQIIKLAAAHAGVLTVTDAAMATGLGIQQVEKVLNNMVDGLRVTMRVEDTGVILYEFPEIVERARITGDLESQKNRSDRNT